MTEIPQKNAVNLADLSSKELETVFAMAITKKDVDAIALSPYEERQFYKLKPKLVPYVKQLALQMTQRAKTALEVGSLEAAVELISIAKSARQTRDKLTAIFGVLDRVGVSTSKSETNINVVIPILGGYSVGGEVATSRSAPANAISGNGGNPQVTETSQEN